ncbi:MAG: DUF115 domain-containing protein [Clostridia bacterium]|nr:DUF115 domain-containing protein [Clostridia bacterium]
MTDILNNNMKLLEKHQPAVYKKTVDYINGRYKPQNNMVERILIARHEDLIINMLVECSGQEYLICDHEDPIGQSYQWIDAYIEPSNKAEIVFGMGFGFHLEVLLTSFENKKVIVVEPNMELFYQLLQVKNLELIIRKSEIFVDERIESILSRVHALLWDTEKGDIQCEPLDVYGEMFWDIWDELRSKFIKLAQNFNVDIATRRRFGELWVHNNIKNANRLFDSSNAGGLVGKFKGIPGILVSAGPSLAKNVHLLNGLKDKAVIMAAGTAAKILEDYGVTPHFMVGIDAQEEEANIHRAIKSQDIYFIYSNQVATGSVEGYTGPKFLMNYPVDLYTAEFLKFAGIDSEFFLNGPSVSNTCADILYKMGCDPIIIVGQDLAYSGGKHYAGEEHGTDLRNIEDPGSLGYIPTKDIHGKDVYTTLGFITMKNWFETYFEGIKDNAEVINATEGGLDIKYAKNDTLINVLNNHTFDIKGVDEVVKKIYEQNLLSREISHKFIEYKEYIKNEIKNLEQMSQKQQELVELIRRDVYHPAKDKRAFEKMLDNINRFADGVVKSPIYHSLLINLVAIDFYLIKLEVEQSTKGMTRYEDVKEIYISAINRRTNMLIDKLNMLRKFLGD